jgi:hypothetical protein
MEVAPVAGQGDGGRGSRGWRQGMEEMRTWVGRTTLSRVNLKENIVELFFFSRGGHVGRDGRKRKVADGNVFCDRHGPYM